MYAIWNEISQRFLTERFTDQQSAEAFIHGKADIFKIVFYE